MRKILSILLFVGAHGVAYADGEQHLAVGMANGWTAQKPYGSGYFQRYTPELVAFGYAPLGDDFYFRPGIRLGYAWAQPEMPTGLRIEEKDTTALIEAGFLYEANFLIPSITLGGGAIYRKLQLIANDPVAVGKDDVSGTEHYLYATVQAGIGLPLFKGFLVCEPFVRGMYISGDARSRFAYGLEATVQLF